MIGEVCRFYSWTVDHVLQMPAPRFFLMLESARKLQSKEYVYQCYISRSSRLENNAFKDMIKFFQGLGGEKEKIVLEEYKPKNKSTTNKTPQQMRNDVMRAFAKDTRINRTAPPNKKPIPPRNGGS